MRILKVELLTPDAAATAHFYGTVLGLPAVGPLAWQVGFSQLWFRAAAPDTAPYYHLAFALDLLNLPVMHGWLAARLPLLPGPGGGTLVDFPNWQAQACYFHDATGNILECIARAGLAPGRGGNTPTELLTGIAEVGAVLPDVPAVAAHLHHAGGVPYYPLGPRLPRFSPLGDDMGLFVLCEVGRGWLPTGRPAEQHWFRAVVAQGEKRTSVEFPARGPLPSVRHLAA